MKSLPPNTPAPCRPVNRARRVSRRYAVLMSKSSNRTTRKSGPLVSITSVGEAGGVPLDGVLLEAENLESAVEAAIGEMHWLEPTDRATVELALSYARQIDMANTVALAAAEVLKRSDELAEEVPSVLEVSQHLKNANDALGKSMRAHYLGPHLHNALRSLGGDPASRKEITGSGAEAAEKPADPLAAMRAKKRGA